MPVPNTFANATATIPLSQLDANFATTITLGNTAIQLGNTVTTLNNMTLANVTVSSGNVTITNVSVTTANVTTANIGTSIITTSETLNYGTANQVQYLNASKVLTGSANLTFDGTTLTPHTLTVSTGVLTVPAGSNTAPSITTSGDTNTGVFFPAADTVAIGTGGTEALRVDSARNMGLGVTPSAWSNITALQVESGSLSAGSIDTYLSSNAFYSTASPSGWKYITSTSATQFYQNASGGEFVWRTAASGTAGNAITFTQAMTLDASGNLGVGTSSPSTFGLIVAKQDQTADTAIVVSNAGTSNAATTMSFALSEGGTKSGWFRRYRDGSGNTEIGFSDVLLFTGNVTGTKAERARITSGGDLLVGATSNIFSRERVHIYKNGGEGLTIQNDNNNYSSIFVKGINSGTCTVMLIRNSADTTVGSITHNGTNTTYGTTSDYRLKHGMQPMTGALAKVQALKPVTYKWNADNSDGEGFIAHELQEVCPDAVVGEKDAVDKEGKPVYQAIDTSFLVATLTAAIQEQQAMIDELKAKVAALENA